MADTVISQIATDSIVLEGKDRVKKVSGQLGAGTYHAGRCVYQIGSMSWTACVGSASHARMSYGWIEFRKRTSATFGEKDIDATYTLYTSTNFEIIVGPKDGTIKIAAFIEDLGADYYFGEGLAAFSGGSMQRFEGSHTMSRIAIIAEDGYIDNDTVAKVYIV